MYTQYFGLREPLFRILDNPAGQYLTAQNKIACEQLYTGLAEGKKVLVLTGVAGSGKKTLVRRAVSALGEFCTLIELQVGDLKLGELIDCICRKIPVSIDSTGSINQRITDLKKATQSQPIKHTVVLIEQVREIHPDLVNGMLSLSRHDSDGSSCIQFVVVSSPDRNNRFEQLVLRSFDRDDLCLCCIESLDSVEVASYVTHYLEQAGCKNKTLFTLEALERIAKYSNGIPRLINLLCNGGLLAAFLEEKKNVDAAMIDEASTHCLCFGTGDIQPVINEQEIELPAKHDSPAEKVSIIQDWPFENQQEGQAASPADITFPKSNDKQSSSAAIVEVEDANSNSSVESVGIRLSFNGNQNQALQTNADTARQSDEQTQQSDNLNCAQYLTSGNADEITPSKANSGTAESVNTETAEKLQWFTTNFTTANASHTNDNKHELGTQPNLIEQNSALNDQDSTADSAFHGSISLPENIGKAAKLSSDQAAGSIGKGSPTISTERPGTDSDPLPPHHPQRRIETQTGDKLGAKSTSSAFKSFGSNLVALGILVLGLFVTFDLEKRPALSIPNTDTKVGSRLGDISIAPVVKTPIEPEHPKYDNASQRYSEWASAETDKSSNRREADKPREPVNTQPEHAKIQKHAFEVEFDVWLRLAEQQLSKKQLTTPKNDNALASYRTILKVDPVHEKALSGIQKIKETYMLWARYEIRRGSVQHARYLYQKALDVAPNDAQVLTALEGLKSSQTNTAKRLADKPDTETLKLESVSEYEQIDELLGRANRQMYLNQLVTPADNNALSTYRKVLRLAPRNSEALGGIARIISTYVNWAKSAMDNHDWDRAEVFYKRALQADPTDRKVISMIRELKYHRDRN